MNVLENIAKATDIESLSAIRNMVNEACDKRERVIRLCGRANELGCGSFGAIKENFENLSPSLFESSKGKKLIARYIDTIGKNRNLSTLYSLYECVRMANPNCDIDYFVENLADNDWNIDRATLEEDCRKLGKILSEAYIMVGEDAETKITEGNAELDSALSFIAENKRDGRNIHKYSAAVKVIRENIEKNEPVSLFEIKGSVDASAEKLIADFNAKYNGQLMDEEVAAIREIAENTDHELVFNRYKASCISKLDEAKERYKKENDSESVEKIEGIQGQIGKKMFNESTLSSDICNLLEIGKVFD